MWWMSGDQCPPLYCDVRGVVAVPDSSCSVDKRLVTQWSDGRRDAVVRMACRTDGSPHMLTIQHDMYSTRLVALIRRWTRARTLWHGVCSGTCMAQAVLSSLWQVVTQAQSAWHQYLCDTTCVCVAVLGETGWLRPGEGFTGSQDTPTHLHKKISRAKAVHEKWRFLL